MLPEVALGMLAPRPLVLLQGFLFFPAMLPDAMGGMVVDPGILPPSGSAESSS